MTQDGTVTAGPLTIALGKILTTSLTIGSGGSGGVLVLRWSLAGAGAERWGCSLPPLAGLARIPRVS